MTKKPAITRCTTESHTFLVPTKHGIVKHIVKQPVESKPKPAQKKATRTRRVF